MCGRQHYSQVPSQIDRELAVLRCEYYCVNDCAQSRHGLRALLRIPQAFASVDDPFAIQLCHLWVEERTAVLRALGGASGGNQLGVPPLQVRHLLSLALGRPWSFALVVG